MDVNVDILNHSSPINESLIGNTANFAAGIFISTVWAVTVIGNGLVLLLYGRYKILRDNHVAALMALLATADGAMGFTALNCWIANFLIFKLVGFIDYEYCRIFLAIFQSFLYLSHISTALIAFDRFAAMYNPLDYAFRDNKKIVKCRICFALILAATLGGSIFIGTVSKSSLTVTACMTQPLYPHWFSMMNAVFSQSLGWLTTFMTLTSLYFMVYSKNSTVTMLSTAQEIRERKRQKSMTRSLAIVLIAYVILWVIPTSARLLMINFGLEITFVRIFVGVYSGLGTTLNPCVNIFIYSWKHQDFKKFLKAFFKSSSVTPASQT